LNLSSAPNKLRALLIICIAGTLALIGTIFVIYSASRTVTQAVGKDTVPTIIAAQRIKATLADAHSNAMNAMVTKEKLGGKYWGEYRKNMNTLHSELTDASQNITYGEEQRTPILTIMSNLSTYEYTVGGAVSNGAEISVDQFMEANRLMQQKILPASTDLNKVSISHLDSIYNQYTKNMVKATTFMYLIGLGLFIILIYTQYYLYKTTHRVFNPGLLLATILLFANTMYSTDALNSVNKNLYTAKNDAFDSLNALWSAKAVAYNANALESLYLLHHQTGIVQTADTINFNLSASRLCSDNKAGSTGGEFKGLLNDVLKNTAFSSEKEAATTSLQEWIKYVDVDKQIRNLEYNSKHNEAIALCVGEAAGQSNYHFGRFDGALNEAIDINQRNFQSNIDSVFKSLNMFPYVTAGFLVLIIAAAAIGIKIRLNEYKI